MRSRSLIFTIMSVVIIGTTVGLFLLLAPAVKDALFYTNLVAVLVTLCILLGNTGAFVSRPLFNVSNVSTSYTITAFAVSILLVGLAFNAIIYSSGIDLKWYIGALLLDLTIFSAIIGFTMIGAGVQIEKGKQHEAKIAQNSEALKLAGQLPTVLNAVLMSSSIALEDKNQLKEVVRSFSSAVLMCPGAKLSNPDNRDKIERMVEAVKRNIDSIATADELSLVITSIRESTTKIKLI